MTSSETRSSADIQREIEQTRQNAAATLAEVEQRLSPGRLTDEALDYVRHSRQGQAFVSDLGSAIRENPLPIIMVAAGLGWLMINMARQSRSNRPRTGSRYGQNPTFDEEGIGAADAPRTQAFSSSARIDSRYSPMPRADHEPVQTSPNSQERSAL